MAFKGLPSVRSSQGRGMRNLPQYKDDKNQELSLLRLRKERERLVQERQRLRTKLDVISVRLQEIISEEDGVRKAIFGLPSKQSAPAATEPPSPADHVLVRY